MFIPATIRDVDVKPMSKSFSPVSLTNSTDILPKAAKEEIPKLKKSLHACNGNLIDYGQDISIKISSYADKMLAQVALTSADEFTKPLTDVLSICSGVNSKSLISGKAAKIPLVQRFKELFASQKVKVM